jgi:hypothetical protein
VEIDERVSRLADAWCERRCFGALRAILAGWPRTGGLTDDWASLGEALKAVRAFASNELTAAEMDDVEKLIVAVDQLVYR